MIASNVAEFDPSPPVPPQPTAHHHYPPHVMQHPSLPPIHAAFPPQYAPSPSQTPVKSEPIESRFPLPTNMPTYMPTLPGPTLPGPPRPHIPAAVAHHYNGMPPRPGQPYSASASPVPAAASSQHRIPQVDGASESDSDSASPPPSNSYGPPRSLHPSLPQPGGGAASGTQHASEEINSDLDDSDSDAEEEDQEGALGETDIVFCTYDKVR